MARPRRRRGWARSAAQSPQKVGRAADGSVQARLGTAPMLWARLGVARQGRCGQVGEVVQGTQALGGGAMQVAFTHRFGVVGSSVF